MVVDHYCISKTIHLNMPHTISKVSERFSDQLSTRTNNNKKQIETHSRHQRKAKVWDVKLQWLQMDQVGRQATTPSQLKNSGPNNFMNSITHNWLNSVPGWFYFKVQRDHDISTSCQEHPSCEWSPPMNL